MQTTCEIPKWFVERMVGTLVEHRDDGLIWLPDLGIGFHPQFDPARYDGSYFDKYVMMDSTEMGHRLSEHRVEFVRGHYIGPLVDFGIGAGAFMQEWWKTQHVSGGFDINEHAVAWLRARGAYVNPWTQSGQAVTFWDSLEHVPDIEPLLGNVTKWVFVSMPIVKDPSGPSDMWRHYRPGEHLLYATETGLITLMASFGFTCVDVQWFETHLGRLDIGSFAFKRVAGSHHNPDWSAA